MFGGIIPGKESHTAYGRDRTAIELMGLEIRIREGGR